MKKTGLLYLLFFLGLSMAANAQTFYLRSQASACDFGNTNASCQLTDPDMNGVYELSYDFGAAPIGRQEFKIYNSDNDTWYPPNANSWFVHSGGSVTFRINTANFQVEAVDGLSAPLCAPGDFNGFNPNSSASAMVNTGGTNWCYTVPNAGTYSWKPTVCGGFDSWQPGNGERDVNSANWSITTMSDNEQFCVTYDPATGRVTYANPPTGIYLRGSQGFPCDFGNTNASCELEDPDGDGVYELTYDFGSTPIGRQEFKIYNAATDTWYPGGPNAWYNHQGGSVAFRFDSNTGEVEAAEDGFFPALCAPGQYNGFDNSVPMTPMGNGIWCYNVDVAGTYEWKPVVCGSFDSWQQTGGERSVNSGNWQFTTTTNNEQICVAYDLATGRVGYTAVPSNIPTMSEWGVMILALLMLIFGAVVVRQRKLALAGTQNSSFSWRSLPFDRAFFPKALLFAGLALVAVFAVAVTFFGYEMTSADVPGSLVALPLLAYLATLLREEQRQ